MKDNKLADLSMDFSVQIIALVKELKAKHETVIANQIGRSGTSIGANIYEANYGQGRKDFISKMEIAYDTNPVKKFNKEICEELGITVPSTYVEIA